MMTEALHFITATTQEETTETAIQALKDQVAAHRSANDEAFDLVMLYMTTHYLPDAQTIFSTLYNEIGPVQAAVFMGCVAEGVIGPQTEYESEPAITLIAGHLNGVSLTPFALGNEEMSQYLQDPPALQEQLALPPHSKLTLVLGDPFSTPIEGVLNAFNVLYPGVPLVGGMASAALNAGGNVLFLNGLLFNEGAVGVILNGDITADVIVSQGCRPVGEPFTITEAEGNLITSIENQPPPIFIQQMYESFTEQEKALLQNGLFLGRAVRPVSQGLGRGDFLIRGVLGIDRQTHGMIVGDVLKPGETVQFHLRDAVTAGDDLEMLLIPQSFSETPAAVFLFTCNSRGTRLYEQPNGDVSRIHDAVGDAPIAGFFASGELGPIGDTNFYHGHTASMVMLRSITPA
ncbi:FIST C-terminal domain-containing protein [Phototrophicus methaneseepsis]|uniref:FIST C-terminal domain-containing protein n=1 Tax=Phototrophicus methaneseepsis TaxID=2710758 RepID=A0A7S8EAY1_9CHLR|nr:FIST N-terminal domain-containing protein [Phototrophicus methaneseepsis]QPC83601.1 FIST C-terminal domain-containing protein [Phototrophicus methaneseepsis]